MNFEVYDPTKHTLEVGTKIRLGGREGEIVLTDSEGGELGYQVEWEKLTHSYLDLSAYPLLAIAISPLTIDKRVKKNVLYLASQLYDGEGVALDSVVDYLNSLKET